MRLKIRPLTAAVLIVVGAEACAQVAGLPGYSAGEFPDTDSSAPPARTEASADDASVPDDATLGEAAGDDHDDGDGSAMGDTLPASGDSGEDGDGGKANDGGQPSDASAVPDGYVCRPGTCGGCCSTAGDCVGGQSVATCGVGGQACKDCTSTGACSQGSCTAPPQDAGPPPMCVVASCSTSNCAGYPIQGTCCKLDQTCGCQWTLFAPCL